MSKIPEEWEKLRADLDKAAAIIERKDREISSLRQENYTIKAELMEQAKIVGMGAERELKLKDTAAALREELKTQRDLRRDWERISDNHKAQLAEAIEALEFYGRMRTDNYEAEGDGNVARATLAKLKPSTGAKEGE